MLGLVGHNLGQIMQDCYSNLIHLYLIIQVIGMQQRVEKKRDVSLFYRTVEAIQRMATVGSKDSLKTI